MSSRQPDSYNCIAELFTQELKPNVQIPPDGVWKEADFYRRVVGKLERCEGAVRLIPAEQQEIDGDLAEDIRVNTEAIRSILAAGHIRANTVDGDYIDLAKVSDGDLVKAIQSWLPVFLTDATAIQIEAVRS